MFISEVEAMPHTPRMIRTKMLADVVEALIGAAFLAGAFAAARTCIHRLLPGLNMGDPSFEIQTNTERKLAAIESLESIVGYRFRHACLPVGGVDPSILRKRSIHSVISTS